MSFLIPNSVLYSMGKCEHLRMENEDLETGSIRNQEPGLQRHVSTSMRLGYLLNVGTDT